MRISTIVWSVLICIAGLYLAVRASNGQMGLVYLRQVDHDVAVEAEPVSSNDEADSETENAPDDLGARRDSYVTYISANPSERNEPNVVFSWSRTIGLWCAALFTLAIMSFLWGDNVFYKLAESVFVGASAGYAMVVGFWTGIVQILLENLVPQVMRASFLPNIPEDQKANLLFIVPLILGFAMLWRLAPVGGWVSRWPLAFFIGATAGLRLVVYFESDFIRQIQATILPLIVLTAEGAIDWSTSLKNTTIVIGVVSCIVYFFFSVEHTGITGAVSRLGIWFLMVTFGAGFGYTVMGRITLLSGRLEFLFDDWLWWIDPVGKRLGM